MFGYPLLFGFDIFNESYDYEGGGTHARVQVNFDDAGSKWLVLAYANLQPL